VADYNVNLKFDRQGEATFYVTEDKKLKWPWEKTEGFDWKDEAGAFSAAKKMSKRGNVVELFDGSDSIILAVEEEAIKVTKKRSKK